MLLCVIYLKYNDFLWKKVFSLHFVLYMDDQHILLNLMPSDEVMFSVLSTEADALPLTVEEPPHTKTHSDSIHTVQVSSE